MRQRIVGQFAPDVAVSGLDVSPSVFVKNELAIRGTVRINAYVNRDVAVQALFETTPGKPLEVVGSTTLRSTQDGEEMPVEFSYVPAIDRRTKSDAPRAAACRTNKTRPTTSKVHSSKFSPAD